MPKDLAILSDDELRAEALDIRQAIFAYEMSGATERIDAANKDADAVYAELRKRNP